MKKRESVFKANRRVIRGTRMVLGIFSHMLGAQRKIDLENARITKLQADAKNAEARLHILEDQQVLSSMKIDLFRYQLENKAVPGYVKKHEDLL